MTQIERSISAPPLKWHGGKHYLANRIIALMPAHTHFVEPYFGGGAVLLAKDPEGVSEVVNDLNGWLSNFWRVLRNAQQFEHFKRRADTMPMSESLWKAAVAKMAAQPDVRQHDAVTAALMFFVRARQSRPGLMQYFATLSRTRTRRGMNEQASSWLTAIEGLPAVHDRLKRVVILNRPALQVIQEQDGANTLFYLDPPYLPETRTTTDSFGAFEMSRADHEVLLAKIKSCIGKVMLSGYPSELYNTQLSDWNRHDFDLPNNAAGGERKSRMTESVWCNF